MAAAKREFSTSVGRFNIQPMITRLSITLARIAEAGQLIAPPPDGASYLGFIFSRAPSPAQAEAALRDPARPQHAADFTQQTIL